MRFNVPSRCAALLVLLASTANAQTKLQQNSFLLEEAYNQDIDIYQHFNIMRLDPIAETWNNSFTVEIPLQSLTHQLSILAPASKVNLLHDSEAGLGDVQLGYKYQWIDEDPLAAAPHVRLILPTGDSEKNLGHNALGARATLPVSYNPNDQWSFHANLGAGLTPNAKNYNDDKADLVSIQYGSSAVYSPKPNLNLMIELAGANEQDVTGSNKTEWNDSFYISPGAAFSFETTSGMQIVPGLAIPMDVASSSYEILFYFSVQREGF